jgi:hypothetical protein
MCEEEVAREREEERRVRERREREDCQRDNSYTTELKAT